MNKMERQQQIKQIIQAEHIGTQEEIKNALQKKGIVVTQATLSRDLREIGLLKLRDKQGKLYYSLSEPVVTPFSPDVRFYVLKVDRAGFMLVLHTNLGEADVLANLIDNDAIEAILGTIAGADTLLVICRDEEIAKRFEKDLSAGL
ncbi:UNVERIFIED_CONTAM: arginine repressor [Streptococcus canis]|uniref:Arginine repressor n=1 Tax=Streptococcus canis FSL Z3-227 TaxID=482234 RepID=A0AAV3FW28_STRCB|nr:arginine repressor [Streptococcus canis]EIQ82940.1 putative arginine repressor [Streptococcus canis FSL Z3-227]MDV5988865.1 arginine repressor [Streptococcus canis]MDV5992816.1 arginine repressor [Streptococcus canis]MDV6000474.1 arginine repressor [Streptococcus canis]MDV6022067.1 arginine repressor [Streptococcus canis]